MLLLPSCLSDVCRVQIATSVKDGTKYAVKIIKKQDGKEALLLQLQSECSHLVLSWCLSCYRQQSTATAGPCCSSCPVTEHLQQTHNDGSGAHVCVSLSCRHCEGGCHHAAAGRPPQHSAAAPGATRQPPSSHSTQCVSGHCRKASQSAIRGQPQGNSRETGGPPKLVLTGVSVTPTCCPTSCVLQVLQDAKSFYLVMEYCNGEQQQSNIIVRTQGISSWLAGRHAEQPLVTQPPTPAHPDCCPCCAVLCCAVLC
jgi:hypothetical protein